MLTEAQLVLRAPSRRLVIECFAAHNTSYCIARAQDARTLAAGRSGGTEPAASIPPQRFEIVQGLEAGRLLRRPQLGKPMAERSACRSQTASGELALPASLHSPIVPNL